MENISRRGFIEKGSMAAFGMSFIPNYFTKYWKRKGSSVPMTGSQSVTLQRRVIGANDRIRIGIIGCGDRGLNAHMEGVYKHVAAINLEIVAVSDPWRIAREQANAKVKEWFGREARQFVSYRDLLTMDGIDAVMIASPDHVHTMHLEASALAGKHIYVEKPLAMEMDKLVRAVDAVKAAGTVVQVGTQLRSLPGIVGARDLFRSGILGNFSRIEECRNGEQPYWYRYLKDVKEKDVDWGEFLSDRPRRPFRADSFSGWYGYSEFSDGPISGLGSHFIDMVHFITGAKFPESCVCLGSTFTWKDEHKFTAPDCIQATWIYPEGFLVSSSNNFGNSTGSTRNFYGDKGMLNIGNWNAPTFSDKGALHRNGTIKEGENPVERVERPDHFLDWLQCIRNGGTPHAPIEAGYQHAVAVLMAAQSYKTGRKTIYDHNRRMIRAT